MVTPEMIPMLWCPTCQADELSPHSGLKADNYMRDGELRCSACESSYPVKHGVPALMPQEVFVEEYWQLWRDHLEKFNVRRAQVRRPDRLVSRWARGGSVQQRFARFIGITEGTLLDVGCGPGKFRFKLAEGKVSYYGLDPLALPDAEEFPFVRGLAEYIPFKNGTFTDIVVLAALDHFRDVERFLVEARRVLKPGGRLHIMQQVHEVRGPQSLLKMAAHRLKDFLEDRELKIPQADAPKHMAEYTSDALRDQVLKHFEIVAMESYSPKWYAPTKLFLSMMPRPKETDRPAIDTSSLRRDDYRRLQVKEST